MTDALMKRVWKRNKDTEYGHGMDCQMKMTDALMKRVWKSNKDNEYGHGMDYQMKMTDALIKHKKRKNINYQKEHMDLRDIISMPVKVKCSCEINMPQGMSIL